MKLPAWFLALAVTLSATLVAADEANAGVTAEIQRLDEARLAALLKSDLPALERLYDDQMVYIHANGRVDTKAGYLTMLRNGDLTYVSLRYDPPPQIRVHGTTATVTGRTHIEMKSKSGQVTQRLLTTTTVYVRKDGSWRIVSYQGTPAS